MLLFQFGEKKQTFQGFILPSQDQNSTQVPNLWVTKNIAQLLCFRDSRTMPAVATYNTTCLYLICATYGFLNLWSIMMCILYNTVDGRNPANLLIWRIYHYVQGFIHVRWLAGFLPSTVSSADVQKHPSIIQPSELFLQESDENLPCNPSFTRLPSYPFKINLPNKVGPYQFSKWGYNPQFPIYKAIYRVRMSLH